MYENSINQFNFRTDLALERKKEEFSVIIDFRPEEAKNKSEYGHW